ncbi:MAG TPA: O-antigen ligase family protein [Polyangia bacterium]
MNGAAGAVASPRALGRVSPVAWWLAFVLGASYALLALGPLALAAVVALWLLALPRLLGAQADAFALERAGALFVFVVAAEAERLDGILGLRALLFCVVALVGAGWLWRRIADVRALFSQPAVVLFGLFLLLQVWSGWMADAPGLGDIALVRLYVFEALLVTAVLARRPGGRALVPALVALAALMALPVMAREILDHERLGLVITEGGELRAGALYGQPNVAGIALDFGLAFAAVLFSDGAIGRRAFALCSLGALAGILATASRGALMVGIVIGTGAWLLQPGSGRAAGRPRLLRAVLVIGGLLLVLRPAGQLLARAGDLFGLEDLSRLQEATMALTGSPGEMMDDDSERLELITEAERRIAARPLFGWGTGAFMNDELRSHVEFLEILGENGAFGAALYALVLLSIGLAVFRLPRSRAAAGLLVSAWLLTHFHNHNLVETPFMSMPIGYVCGLASLQKG